MPSAPVAAVPPPAISGWSLSLGAPADRLPAQRMLELYQYELSDIWDQDLDTHGEYGYPLDRYFDPGPGGHGAGWQAHVARVDGHYAGVALVDDQVKVHARGRWLAQFFVLKKYRRRGLGRAMAGQLFATLPGAWEVGQMPLNLAAQAFWRRVITEHTAGHYTEHRLTSGWWQGVVQCFQGRPPA